ncbi:hypothetical protein ABZ387_06805 [Streptomyces flaveolus]|uniref:hypothetical protein n=1 Tax=Streptomyces flaveolus TaxID=67297 RepID=UPI0033FEE52D
MSDHASESNDATAFLKQMCAELGINTISYTDHAGTPHVEIDIIHVASLIEAGALAPCPADHAPFVEFARRFGIAATEDGR